MLRVNQYIDRNGTIYWLAPSAAKLRHNPGYDGATTGIYKRQPGPAFIYTPILPGPALISALEQIQVFQLPGQETFFVFEAGLPFRTCLVAQVFHKLGRRVTQM